MEEAFDLPRVAAATKEATIHMYIAPESIDDYKKGIIGISERVRQAQEIGIGYTICSLTLPSVQQAGNHSSWLELARDANDWIADQIKGNRNKMGAFAVLSMHDPMQAADELRRCVMMYRFHGALLNDWQLECGPNGEEKLLVFDGLEYDAFWAVCEELDVPVYLHPSTPQEIRYNMQYKGRQ
jgi:2,3-dihydroxybenzoate decarboxylase